MIVHHTDTTAPRLVFHGDSGEFYPKQCASGTSLRYVGGFEDKVLVEIRTCVHTGDALFETRFKQGDTFLVDVLFSNGKEVTATVLCTQQKLINEHRSFVLKVISYI